jgi:hypothetical protein
MTTKYTKWSQNIPNGSKMDQLAIKFTNICHCKTLKIYPNWDFWFENIPSGNPVGAAKRGKKLVGKN